MIEEVMPEIRTKCDMCGKVDELRPYGPNGENICCECGMKNGAVTFQQIGRIRHGVEMPLRDAQLMDALAKGMLKADDAKK